MSDVNMEQIPGLTKTVGYVMYLKAQNDKLQREADLLRAELEAVRGQQPVAWQAKCNGSLILELCLPDADDDRATLDWEPLYALPPQQPDAVSVPRELLDKLLHAEAECLHGQFEEALESLRALLSTKNAEEGE